MRRRAPALLFVLLLAAFGCITGSLPAEKPITVKKLDIRAQNFSELLSLGIPLHCAVRTPDGTLYVKIRDGKARTELDGYVVIMDGTLIYLRLPPEKKEEYGCDWIKVDRMDEIFKNSLSALNPMKQDLNSIPGSSFLCDAAFYPAGEFEPEGHICWYFDIK